MLDVIIVVGDHCHVCSIHRLHRGLRTPVGKEECYEFTA